MRTRVECVEAQAGCTSCRAMSVWVAFFDHNLLSPASLTVWLAFGPHLGGPGCSVSRAEIVWVWFVCLSASFAFGSSHRRVDALERRFDLLYMRSAHWSFE